MTRPSQIELWPQPFDTGLELEWGDPVMSARLLAEHLDTRHDSASRRPAQVARHIKRLSRLLAAPPARILDAACGPGLYATALAEAGHSVLGVDIGPAVIRHAKKLARQRGVADHCAFEVGDLSRLDLTTEVDAAVLIYHVLESFPRRTQPAVLRHLRDAVTPEGRVIVEMRTRADHPGGRLSSWDIAEWSLLSERRHLLLSDSTYDEGTLTYILRETAVFDDGTTATQQTTSQLTPLSRIPGLFARGGLTVTAIYDGWSARRADSSAESVLVVARPA